MRTMKGWPGAVVSMMAASMLLACEQDPVRANRIDVTRPVVGHVAASVKVAASGSVNQTAITSLDVQTAGGNTILDQTAVGAISGTLTGHFEDDLRVVLHPNGKFDAHFTITCTCTVDGKFGVLEIVAGDTGELVSPTLASFAGRAVIKGGTGALSGLRGVLQIEGTVDVTTGLATYAYTGDIHFEP
ncbi:MAG TPA: hypothetical protein VLE53_07845 [Gemmatimonadaceae bacterium]|nr:hypothetical protein [Gemmatimonadaceae bacterium]